MAEQDGGAAAPKRKTRGKGGGDKSGESGDGAGAGAVDNGGEKVGEADGIAKTAVEVEAGGGTATLTSDTFERRSFKLDDMQRGALGDAILDDEGSEVGTTNQDAFWRAAADRMGFNSVTVERSVDFEDTGEFTAFPADNLIPAGTGDLHVQHETAIERMERGASEATLNTRSLVFDVRDFLLEQIKARPKPWSATSSDEQHDVAAACEHAGKELVRKIVEAIASDDRTAIRALLESYAEKDGIKVTLKVKTFSEEEALNAVIGLHRAQGKHVLITVASADDYAEDRREAEIMPDQPGLGFEAGSDINVTGDDRDLAGDDEDEPTRRVNVESGMVERREEPGGDWIETEPASLDDLRAETNGTFRVNLTTGMIEFQPQGADSEHWEDVRAAEPDELGAERNRVADFEE